MKQLKYNRGMTLIEVLIASVILFIAVSAISFVARSSALHEQRLIKNIDRAVLAEYIRDEVSYHYQYKGNSNGIFNIANTEYQWRVNIIEEKPVMRFISAESSSTSTKPNDTLVLYEVEVTEVDRKKIILSLKDVYWKN